MPPGASKRSPAVDRYIGACPKTAQPKLRKVRAAIRAVAPDAVEVISYRLPGYSYPGHPLKGMFAWFGLQSSHIGLYLRPPTIAQHHMALAKYSTTKAAVHLPLDREVPVRLVQKLVRTSRQIMKGTKP